MIRIGIRNLLHDRIRLAVSVLGVTVAVGLMLMQTGIYSGYMKNVSIWIDSCSADLWISSPSTVNIDTARPMSENVHPLVEATPGIAWAEKMIHGWAYITLPDGAGLWSQVNGFDPDTGIGGPPEMLVGSFADLKKPGTYIVDESSMPMMHGARVGDKLENYDYKMEIVGLCRGVKSVSTYPIMFASYRTCQEQSLWMQDKMNFVAAKFESGTDREMAMERLRRIPNVEIFTREGLGAAAQHYWKTKTGIGVGIGLTVTLAFFVGFVIVGQTMYASTVERLREYATLKALGSTSLEICSIIGVQAVLVGVAGYALGAFGIFLAQQGSMNTIIAIDVGAGLFAVIFAATMLLCLGSSVLSILRVLRVDPALVFRV